MDSEDPKNDESVLYDVGRYEARNYIMGIPGAVAPVVFGGKIRTVLAYLDREKMQARNLSPVDVMKALDYSNVFFPSADAKFGDDDYIIDSNSMYQNVTDMGDIPLRYESGRTLYLKDVATPEGCQLHPDQRGAGQRQAGGLHPGLSPARRQHAEASSRPWAAGSRSSPSG